jgi:hypothetical protein
VSATTKSETTTKPETASKPETAARILVQRRDFSIEKQLVNYRRFLPVLNERTGVWETSVFDADGLNDIEIWEIGRIHVAAARGKRVYGHGEIARTTIEGQGLSIERTEPPIRHCDIRGWPPPEDKEERMSLAQHLAADATLKLNPAELDDPQRKAWPG